MICKRIVCINILKQEIICLHTIKGFQKLLFIVCTQLNGFKNCYLALLILFDINHLFAHS